MSLLSARAVEGEGEANARAQIDYPESRRIDSLVFASDDTTIAVINDRRADVNLIKCVSRCARAWVPIENSSHDQWHALDVE